jgi:hypothetical protein
MMLRLLIGEEAEGGPRRGVDARPGSNMAPACPDKIVARRPLQGGAGAGEGMIGVTQEDGEPAVVPEVGAFAGPADRPRRRRADV